MNSFPMKLQNMRLVCLDCSENDGCWRERENGERGAVARTYVPHTHQWPLFPPLVAVTDTHSHSSHLPREREGE